MTERLEPRRCRVCRRAGGTTALRWVDAGGAEQRDYFHPRCHKWFVASQSVQPQERLTPMQRRMQSSGPRED